MQIIKDHVEQVSYTRTKKPVLTQCVGIDPEEMLIKPYIAKGKPEDEDWHLLCSAGLTDMVSNAQLCEMLSTSTDPRRCVDSLLQTASDYGGRDNITVIVCRIRKGSASSSPISHRASS